MAEPALSLVDQINTNGHIPIPFKAPYSKFEEAHDAMAESAKELQERGLQNFGWKLNPEKRGSRVGYKFAKREEGKTDNKIFFHEHPDAHPLFNEFLRNRDLPKTNKFLFLVSDLYKHAADAARDYLTVLDEAFPGIKNEFDPEGEELKGYLRMLQYKSNPDNDNLATGHNDIGHLTLQLYESGPGLWMDPITAEKPIPVEKHEGTALGFRGFQLHLLLKHLGYENFDQMLPDYHGVSDIPGENRDGTRRSTVFFLDHPSLYFSNDYGDTHKKIVGLHDNLSPIFWNPNLQS